MRMDRRAGLLGPPMPSLSELFAAMTVEASDYRSSTTSVNYCTCSVASAASKPAWAFWLYVPRYSQTPEYEFAKVTFANGSYSKTDLQYSSESSLLSINGTSIRGYVYGGQLWIAKFPGFDPEVVDTLLSTAGVTKLVTPQGGSSGYNTVVWSSASPKQNSVYIASGPRASSIYCIYSGAQMGTPLYSENGTLDASGSNYTLIYNGSAVQTNAGLILELTK